MKLPVAYSCILQRALRVAGSTAHSEAQSLPDQPVRFIVRSSREAH